MNIDLPVISTLVGKRNPLIRNTRVSIEFHLLVGAY
jgi:hypothetical protein